MIRSFGYRGAMLTLPFQVGENLKDVTSRGEDGCLVTLNLQTYRLCPTGTVILHWHEEIQFVLQRTGSTLYTVDEKEYVLNPGDCLFVNAGWLHKASPIPEEGSSYICIMIHPSYICGGNETIRQELVQPLISSSLSALLIRPGDAWMDRVLGLLEKIVAVYEERGYAFKLELQELSSALWLEVLKNNKEHLETQPVLTKGEQQRLSRMLSFIQEHYPEDLSLEDIAQAGALSRSECCRFFKRAVLCSPMAYLSKYRILASAGLLIASDKSITEVARLSGFSSPGYYSECFKKVMNTRPMDYRKRFSTACPTHG